jgi:NitT/TauT family transport system ATP-binding protein
MADRPVRAAAAQGADAIAAGAGGARMAPATAALEFDHVTCAFAARGAVPGAAAGRYVAVENASLDVSPGEFVSVVGPTGCGKSTLLNVAAGLLAPTAGELRVFGAPLSGINRDAGYLFQAEALMPWRSALANVTAGLEFRGVAKAEAEPRARDWLARVGLSGFEDRYPHQLSGGMRKRVALAQVLILDPKILLMDEPFSALDVQTRQLMENELLDLWNADRKSVLFITHDLEEAISLSDRVVVLSAGPATRPIGEFVIDLPRPRDVSEIRMTPRFVALHQAIWHAMKDEVLKAYARGRREGATEEEAANG